MKIETEAEVLRLFNAEGWLRNTIAKQLGLHHSAVARVLARNGIIPKASRVRSSKVDEFIPFIESTLEKYPKLNATRLHHMVKDRGYKGGVDHFRDIVRRLRPVPKGEVYLRLSTLPGEQAQCDWAHFGKIKIGNAERRLLAFVMVLSYSHKIFVQFYLNDSTANFLRGHIDAFDYFQGVPRTVLYDNLKSAVIERVGDAIHFNPDLLALSAHYRFAPRPVPPARPNEKGRVERAIRYVRGNFFLARNFDNVKDLNMQVLKWCNEEAIVRTNPQNRLISIDEAFKIEKESLLSINPAGFPVFDRKPVRARKTPYIRFDLNDYSIPARFAHRELLVEATLDEVSITDGVQVVALHPRSFEKGKQIENPHHISDLVAEKRKANKHRSIDRLRAVAPSCEKFFCKAAQRGLNLGRLTQLLLQMLDLYGAGELEAALSEILNAGPIHSQQVLTVLQRRRAAKGLPPPVPLHFAQVQTNQVSIKPLSLKTYDQLINHEAKE